MNKHRIVNHNNKDVWDYLSACRLQSKKSFPMKENDIYAYIS
ncbi:MAG: hypothetical protein PHR96_05235 [Clostridia bacterium]|nr:hypothetical protein [Clostridia bacterium]